MAVLVGQPVVGQVQVEAGRLDRDMAGLGLDRLEGHPGFSEPGETGMSKLMARGPLEAGPISCGAHDHIDAVDAEPLSSSRTLQGHEDPIARTVRRSLFAQVVTECGKECVRDRGDPLVATLALGNEQRPLGHRDISESQAQHLTTPQAAENHGQDHGPVPLRPQRPEQSIDLRRCEDLGQRTRDAHQRHDGRAAPSTAGGESPRDWVRPHRCVGPSDQIRVEARHRRQPSRDRPGGKSRLAVTHPDHPAIAPLMGQELEDVGRHHLDRLLVDHAEERLEVEGDCPQAVGPQASGHELQIAVQDRMAKEITVLTGRRRGADKAREGCHPGTLPVPCELPWDGLRITRVLSVRAG